MKKEVTFTASRRCRAAHPRKKEINRKGSSKLTQKWGMILLAVWLILTGLLQLVKMDIPYIGVIMSVIAVAAGVLILLDK